MKKSFIFCVISIVIILNSCKSLFLEKKPGHTQSTVVSIKNITSNDLAQVLIFTEDDEKEILFKKDFYSRYKSRREIRSEITEYIARIKRYKNKKVKIIYYKNNMGDLVVWRINRFRRQ